MQPQSMHHEEEHDGYPVETHQTQAALIDTIGLDSGLAALRATGLIQKTVAAFDGQNFSDLSESVAATVGEEWLGFETREVEPVLNPTSGWLAKALTEWPAEKADTLANAEQAEKIARGNLVDTLSQIARERVRVDMGEQLPKEPLPPPLKPALVMPEPETELSDSEREEKSLFGELRTNRALATGNPEKRIRDIHNPSPRTKFVVAALATIFMGYLEFLMGFDITKATLSPAASYAVSLFITVGTNLLALYGTERLHFLLSYWGAKKAYKKYLAMQARSGKAIPVEPEHPDMMTWVAGLGSMVILATCLIALVRYRQHVVNQNSFLEGSEIAVYALCVSVIVTVILHLRYTSPLPEHFFERETELVSKLEEVGSKAKAEEGARNQRNRQKAEQAKAAHRTAMANYEMAMEAYNTPAPDPVDVAIEVYRNAVNEVISPLDELHTSIEEQIAHRAQIVLEYHEARNSVLHNGFCNLIGDLLNALHHKSKKESLGFNPEVFCSGEPRQRILGLIPIACHFSLDNQELDTLIANTELTIIRPELLTEFEAILTSARNDEQNAVQGRRRQAQLDEIEIQRAEAAARAEEAKQNLRKLPKFR